MRQDARQAGLTVKQFRYYAAWFGGQTEQQIAFRFGTKQPRVSEVLCRARLRNPALPLPPRLKADDRRVFAA